jgi:hypothetical protein
VAKMPSLRPGRSSRVITKVQIQQARISKICKIVFRIKSRVCRIRGILNKKKIKNDFYLLLFYVTIFNLQLCIFF